MAASLGRPPVTSESRVPSGTEDDYSASTDLCFIFERILTDVYAKRTVSTKSLSTIATLHRKWGLHFRKGMITDRIPGSTYVADSSMPNISVLHLIEAYHWTIMLLTRPFLTEAIMAHVAMPSPDRTVDACTGMSINNRPVLACVHSAVKTIDLLKVLLGVQGLPRRLPYVTNSLFVAGLVLGFVYFGDFEQTFPLASHLDLAHRLLLQFSDDILAQRNAQTIGYLREACDSHVAARFSERVKLHDSVVAGMFGRIDDTNGHEHEMAKDVQSLQQAHVRNETVDEHSASESSRVPAMNGYVRYEETGVIHGDLASTVDEIMTQFQTGPLSMSPRTLCFDSLFDTSPFFSTALYDT